jgi:DNA helicase-2/ATP-dependent DNA helicase PcrA
MRHRIEALLNVPVQHLWIGTFHGLAHRMLRRHWREAGLPQNFQIIDSDDQLRLIKRLFKNLEVDDSRWVPKEIQWFINAQKDEGLRPQHLDDEGDPNRRQMISLYQSYEEVCQRGGLVDFAELLLRQDTNAIQYAWLRLLAGSDGVPFAVGDDDQSIYRWRGARVEHIHRFQKDFPGTLVVKLEQNYRSTATILNAANAVIANNASRLGKNLWTDGAEGEAIRVYSRATCARTRQSCIDRMRNPGCSRKALSMPAFRTVFTAACDFSSAWKSRTRLPTCA